ncbi:MAG: aspartyl protease family protein, partial [Vicinamibacterales bacterium]
MTRTAGIALAVALPLCLLAQTPPDAARLKQLLEGHRLFELRDAIAAKTAPPFYEGVVAGAFGRFDEAERLLAQAIREASTAPAADEAREALAHVYLLTGQSVEATSLIDELLKTHPGSADYRNARDFLARFRDQRVESRRPRSMTCTVRPDGLSLPLEVNGTSVEWLVDTGFSNAALNESEAQMLGLSIQTGGQTQDFNGGSAPARTAVADRMVIGGTVLRDVPLLVFPDSQPPWNELPAGHRGATGLPVALALQTFGWTRDGTCQIGAPAAPTDATAPPNLVFDESSLILRALFEGRPLDFVLDSGNQADAQLWARFADEFASLVREKGRKSTRAVSQIGGTGTRETINLPEVRLDIGGFAAVLRPAEIFASPTGDGAHHGN